MAKAWNTRYEKTCKNVHDQLHGLDKSVGDELNKLAEKIAKFLSESDFCQNAGDCGDLKCQCCPVHWTNAYTTARGFVKELVYEHGIEVVE